MNWTKRFSRLRHSTGSSPNGTSGRLRNRRVTVENLESRHMLSVGYEIAAAAGEYDFGDAPDTYGTTLSAGAAYHEATGPTLGLSRDAESDGLPTVGATGDDADGQDDENGVIFESAIVAGRTGLEVTVNVQNASSGAMLDAWIDFDGDGVFSESEQIADSVSVSEGDNTITFDAPEAAASGETYARFRLSSAGSLAATGSAADGEVEDYQVTIYPATLATTPESLGTVEYMEVTDLDLSEGAKVYSFTTARAGYLTVDAQLDSSGGEAMIRLLNGTEIVGEAQTEDGYARIDQLEATSGTTYTLQLMGSNSDVTLRICNLVEEADGVVTVNSTSDDDVFAYVSGESNHELTINGIGYEFALDAITSVSFDAGDGSDEVTLTGSSEQETATFAPGAGTMTNTVTDFVITVAGAEDITLNSGGGDDSVEFEDSDGDDTLVATPDQMTLSGTPTGASAYSLTANAFRYAHGYARNGGDDTATLEGSESADRVKAYEEFVRLFGSGYNNRAKFFETVTADTLGGSDNGVMLASDTADVVWAMENDIRIARDVEITSGSTPEYDELSYNVTIVGCEYFTARADGNDDWIEMHDSDGNDVMIAKPGKMVMMNGPDASANTERGSEYSITARGFRNMSSIADQGGDNDVAKLYDSASTGTDTWAADYVDGETWSSMTSPNGLLYEVTGFDSVGGYGFNGNLGEDVGTNVKDHDSDVDFVFEYGYWE